MKGAATNNPPRDGGLGLTETVVATLLTGLALFYHVLFYLKAGPLWRDEVNTLAMATMPSFSAITGALRFDSFPLLPTLLLRAWVAAFGESDSALRAFGLLVGVVFLGAVWATARMLRCRAPWLALALVGISPVVIRAIDSVRPYGLGLAGILLCLGLVWRAVAVPSIKRFGLATLAAVFSVQCLYPNALLLLAIGIASVVAARRHERARVIVGVGVVGGVAAASLIPYLPSIRAAADWGVLVRARVNLGAFADALGGAEGIALWTGLAVASLGALAMARRAGPAPDDDGPALARYGTISWVGAACLFLGAIFRAKVQTQAWYYVPLMVVAAPAIEASLASWTSLRAARVARAALVAAIATVGIAPTNRSMAERRTNIDRIADDVARQAAAGDLIVVYPWYFAVGFQHYYKGTVPWTTLPPLPDRTIHRYDLLKERMRDVGAIDPVLAGMAQSLRSGHRVWLVGGLPESDAGRPPPTLPAPPLPEWGWVCTPYVVTWGLQADYFLRSHAENGEVIPPPTVGPVNPLETVPVIVVVSGWR